MSFDSLHFLFFFILVVAIVFLLKKQVLARNSFLLVASYYFYGCWDWRFLSLIVISTLVDYSCGLALNVTPQNVDKEVIKDKRRKLILLISLTTNLGLLAIFKYFNFFIDSAVDILSIFGITAHITTLRIILPVGISFYTFQTLSYTIDLYRGHIATERSLLNFALYVAFFPQLVAGPIERAKHLLPQITAERPISYSMFSSGVYLVFWGLVKKIVIADNVAVFVNNSFGSEQNGGLFALLGIYAFAVQIYCDFSGYSDIARGTARCMGFDLMLNFNLPYFSTNPSEFWNRWHISLSSWLRDYLYIPLGGNRVGERRNYFNLMTTMTLGGLWHGASWIFVIWGIYQGALLCGYRLVKPLIDRIKPDPNGPAGKIWHILSILFFFQLVNVGWLIFRAENLQQVLDFLIAIATNFPGPIPYWVNFGLLAILGANSLLLIFVQYLQYRSRDLNVMLRLPIPLRAAFYAAGFLAIIIFGRIHGSAFIYFQF